MQKLGGYIIFRIVLVLSALCLIMASHTHTSPVQTVLQARFYPQKNPLQYPTGSIAAAKTLQDGIKTNNSYTVEELVRDIFVKGGCENVSNIKSFGNKASIGYFEKGSSTIGLKDGVLMSTGDIRNAEGPNGVTDASTFFEVKKNDKDLKEMATDVMYDPIGLEFDFVPLDSFVTFRYVFASEEYCEFVGSIYNDVFGFFISGPGINGDFSQNARNVAIIPGTEDNVSINNVNHRFNKEYFIKNYLAADAESCRLEFTPSPHVSEIEYDGFTQPMVASLKLSPCETYHIRLVIADVGDGFFDSAVFLEAGSFNIGGAVSISGQTEASGSSLVEGCSEGYLLFEREDPETIDFPVSVHFIVSPSSTATPGQDFDPIPSSITIPAGESMIKIPIHPVQDNQAERKEKLVIDLDIPCACYRDSAILYIEDPPELHMSLPEAVVCKLGTSTLSPQLTGGTPPYTFNWENGENGSSRTISAQDAGNYRLTLTDFCGVQVIDSAYLQIQEAPLAKLEGTLKVCAGDTAWFNVGFTGSAPWQIGYRRDGLEVKTISDIYENPYPLPVTEPGIYTLDYFSDAYCEGEKQGEAQLAVWELNIEAETVSASCADIADGQIQIRINGGTPPYNWNWDHGPRDISELDSLAAGTYGLLLTDANGCKKQVAFELEAPAPLQAVGFDCEDLRNQNLVLSASGGTPPYRYSANGSQFGDESVLHNIPPGETHRLIIQDARECRLEQDFTMPVEFEKMVDLPNILEINLGSKKEIPTELLIPNTLLANVRWSPGDHLSCVNCLNPEVQAREEHVYTIHVFDIFGCSDEASIKILVDRSVDLYVPNAFSPNGDGLNDHLLVFGNEAQIKRVLLLQIYDRWGNLLYEAKDFPINDETTGWDGAFRGKRMNAGSYVYQVQLELVNGGIHNDGGQVTLMR